MRHRMPRKRSMERARDWVPERRGAGLPFTAAYVSSGLLGRVGGEVEGGWTAFVESLGIEYRGVRKRRWADEKVLEEIGNMEKPGSPHSRAPTKKTGQGLYIQARQRFGSWDAALRAAGIDPKSLDRPRRWSRTAVIEAICERRDAGLTLERAVEKRFAGGWGEALAEAEAAPREGDTG